MKITKEKTLNVKTGGKCFKVSLQCWEGERGYVVRVPVFPEIVTEGSSITEAKKMAREAIGLCLKCEGNEHYSNLKSKRHSSVAAPIRI